LDHLLAFLLNKFRWSKESCKIQKWPPVQPKSFASMSWKCLCSTVTWAQHFRSKCKKSKKITWPNKLLIWLTRIQISLGSHATGYVKVIILFISMFLYLWERKIYGVDPTHILCVFHWVFLFINGKMERIKISSSIVCKRIAHKIKRYAILTINMYNDKYNKKRERKKMKSPFGFKNIFNKPHSSQQQNYLIHSFCIEIRV